MGLDPYRHYREKQWRYLYGRTNKLHRARQLGFVYPRQPSSEIMNRETTNVLFVCSMNKWRSPTAEKVFSEYQLINTRSGGTSQNARRTVSSRDIQWADVVLVMETKHRQQLQARFPNEIANTELHVLHIPDDYQFMDEELIEFLHDTVDELLGV